MTKTLAEASVEAQREFIVRAIERSRRASTVAPAVVAPAVVARPALTASAAPAPAPVAEAPPVSTHEAASAEQDLALGAHEAGHAVIAAVFGAQVGSAEVWRPGRPHILTASGLRMGGVCEYAHLGVSAEAHYPLITAAGAAAQAVMLHGPEPSSAQISALLAGTEDGRELQQMAFSAGGGRFSPGVDVLPLVLRCWPAIAQLAVAMKRGKVISHRNVTAALGLSRNSELHPFELASIRSGLRTVPVPRRARRDIA